MVADPELARLLLQEIERHLTTLRAKPRDTAASERAVHALKGSAGLAGERELAATLERLHRRVRAGAVDAVDEAASIVALAAKRLAAGESALPAAWPVPPDDLSARPLDPLVRAQYRAEVGDRLTRLDEALSSPADQPDVVLAIYRHVHTMKGAASAVGDEPMSWFCHGLEERLKAADPAQTIAGVGAELARWRVVLGALLDDPETALAMLRTAGRPSQVPKPAPSRPSGAPTESEPPRSSFEEATIRVPSVDVDRLLERFDGIDLAREGLGSRAEHARETALALRELRGALVAALRLIGPPRPWGAPAAALRRVEGVAGRLDRLGDDLDAASTALQLAEHSLRDDVMYAKRQLSRMRQTSVGRVFGRLTTAIESEARRSGRAVIVRVKGADQTVDRRIAEQLIDPCLQLVRNSVAHGIELPDVRIAARKVPSGTISLSARKVGNRLAITIEDDGAGVAMADLRARALESGLVTPEVADSADDDTLLSLLFVPGFSTRDSTDLLAGRGIGLEIARSVVQRMGGAIRLTSRVGEGFAAHLEVPVESGLLKVLWVVAGKSELALPAVHVRRVRQAAPFGEGPSTARTPHLLTCLDPTVAYASASYLLDLELGTEDAPYPTASLGVDGVGGTEELLLRPLGPLVASLGPYSGAIVRGDGSLRLALDAWAIAPRARALAAAGRPASGRPPAMRR